MDLFNYLYIGIIFSLFIGFYIFYKLAKTAHDNNQSVINKHNLIKEHFIERMKVNQELSKFLIDAHYLEKFARLNNKLVYKYIYNNNTLYKFKDFTASTGQKLILNNFSENEMHFENKLYERVDLQSQEGQDFLNKYLEKIQYKNYLKTV